MKSIRSLCGLADHDWTIISQTEVSEVSEDEQLRSIGLLRYQRRTQRFIGVEKQSDNAGR